MSSFSLKSLLSFVVCALFTTSFGCCFAGYNVGPNGLYSENIQTIFVPMVEADVYREAMGERLTEALCKKITEQTPYRLAGPRDANAELSVRIVAENQYVSALNRYDDTRQKNVQVSAFAILRARGSGAVLAQTERIPLNSVGGATIDGQSYLVAEMGQSTATAQQEAIDKLAEQIVGLLEIGW